MPPASPVRESSPRNHHAPGTTFSCSKRVRWSVSASVYFALRCTESVPVDVRLVVPSGAVPASVVLTVVPPAGSDSVADRGPAAIGEKPTRRVQDAPAASVVPLHRSELVAQSAAVGPDTDALPSVIAARDVLWNDSSAQTRALFTGVCGSVRCVADGTSADSPCPYRTCP